MKEEFKNIEEIDSRWYSKIQNRNKNQSGSELFELFDYSNSKDRIVVFGIRIRSIFKTRIVFELFE